MLSHDLRSPFQSWKSCDPRLGPPLSLQNSMEINEKSCPPFFGWKSRVNHNVDKNDLSHDLPLGHRSPDRLSTSNEMILQFTLVN